MAKKDTRKASAADPAQMSLLDELQRQVQGGGNGGALASEDIEALIEMLGREKERARHREDEERRRREREEEARKAHVREVTRMDLPLDWENAFGADTRAAGVHADTPADGLVLSLANLGRVDIESSPRLRASTARASSPRFAARSTRTRSPGASASTRGGRRPTSTSPGT